MAITAIPLRWIARILSLAAIGILLLFMIGEGFNPFRFTPRDLALTLFLPMGLLVGLVMAWRWELLGGLVVVVSIVGFYAVHFILAGSFPKSLIFLAFAAPGFLFLIARLLATAKPASEIPTSQ